MFKLSEYSLEVPDGLFHIAWGAGGSERPPAKRASCLSAEEHVLRCFESPTRAFQFGCVVSKFVVVPCKVPMP